MEHNVSVYSVFQFFQFFQFLRKYSISGFSGQRPAETENFRLKSLKQKEIKLKSESENHWGRHQQRSWRLQKKKLRPTKKTENSCLSLISRQTLLRALLYLLAKAEECRVKCGTSPRVDRRDSLRRDGDIVSLAKPLRGATSRRPLPAVLLDQHVLAQHRGMHVRCLLV